MQPRTLEDGILRKPNQGSNNGRSVQESGIILSTILSEYLQVNAFDRGPWGESQKNNLPDSTTATVDCTFY